METGISGAGDITLAQWDEITTAEFAVAAIVTYAFAGILIALTAKAFKSEKLMFNA